MQYLSIRFAVFSIPLRKCVEMDWTLAISAFSYFGCMSNWGGVAKV
jgi:hypothetical protein